MSKGRARYQGSPRPPSRKGIYTKCWTCRGRGYIRSKGVKMACAKCAGDGLIRVGTKSKGRGRARRGRRSGPLMRSAQYAAGCTVFVGVAGQTFGTAGQVVALVLVVAFTVLKVAAYVLRGVAAVFK